jgi:transposase
MQRRHRSCSLCQSASTDGCFVQDCGDATLRRSGVGARHRRTPTGNNGACGVSSLRLAWIDVHEIVNALRSKHRTGCQWRLLPADVPPMSSVRSSFDTWSRDGTFVNINDTLRQPARHALDCNLAPSISVLDSQSTTTTEAGGERGDDGGKKGQRAQTAILG